MTEFINGNPILTMLLAMLLAAAAAAACAALLIRRGDRRQARMLGRLRSDSEAQAQSLAQMGRALQAAMHQMENLSSAIEARQDRLRQTLDERMDRMTRSNEQKLEQMRETVSEKLDGRLSESFRAVNGQLANVHKGLGEMRELALGVTDLRKMLGGVKTRGVWGEVQLRSLLSQMFAPGQYIENAAIPAGSQTRVEFALRMPTASEVEALLPIDSKFPQEDYLRMVEAAASGDGELAERCAAQMERAVMEQAKLIHDKYIRPPQTTDFAVMFLPTEGLYAEVARRNGLLERVQSRYRVMVSGPATLCALLTSLQMGFRTCTLEKRSGEVLNMLAGMKQDFARFDESIQRMRQRLSQAESELDALETRARKVSRALNSADGER